MAEKCNPLILGIIKLREDSMKNLKIKLPARDEKGIALLFTLGILSVLLVIALGFATTSITERRAASNNNDLTAARMLAESAVNRAIGAMRFYADSGYQFDDIISHDISSTPPQNQQTFDMLYKLNTVVNGSLIWPSWSWSDYDKTANSAVHWQYVNNGLDTTDAKYKLIGRYAYVVFGTSGKLDPAACVSQTVAADEGATYDGVLGDIQDRNGASVNEISIYNIANPSEIPDPRNYILLPLTGGITPLTQFSFYNNPLLLNGKLTTERWADWETMFTALGIGTAATAQREKYREWFILNNPKDPEAFWIDINGDGIEEPSELYHRFNLARTDWDTFCTASPDTTSIAVKKILDNAPATFSNIPTHDGVGIKWLKNYTNLPPETFPDAATRAKQIVANLIDYCDGIGDGTDSANDEVTRDSDTDPTYTGNEITPYINEIAIRVDASAKVEEILLGVFRKFTYNITYYLGAEVINIYGAKLDLNKNTTLTILDGTVYFKYTTPGDVDTNFTDGTISLNNKVITLSTITTDPLNSDYTFKWDTGTINPALSITQFNANGNAKIISVKVQIKKAKLNYNNTFADFAKPDYTGGTSEVLPPASPLTSQPGDGTSPTGTCFFSYQVDDPRQNLNDGDWDQAKQQLSGAYATLGTQGLINSTKVTCTTNGDAESGSTPLTISTNYIRNASMQSPWEIGFIHRGAKWETINLKTYNYDDDNSGGAIGVNENGAGKDLGIGAYSNGDANILDQVKTTSATQVYGKINVQAAKANATTGELDVLKALLGYIRFGVPMDSTNSNPGNRGLGTILDYATDITNIVGVSPTPVAGSILAARNTAPFKTRAQIVRAVKLSNGSEFTQTTDAAKEEIIGKFINLTKAQASDTYTIIAIAQTIKDVGAPSTAATGITISKDLNQDGIINPTNPTMKGDPVAESAVGFRDASGTRTAKAGSIPDFYETLPKPSDATAPACKLGQYDLGTDEILAEQKIMATVYRDTLTGRWRILRYEYLDE